jgi:hypothetical protein
MFMHKVTSTDLSLSRLAFVVTITSFVYLHRMKRLNLLLGSLICLLLCSWGYKGHKAIAEIALMHLTPKAKLMVAAYLKNESISDVASWADEIRREPAYRSTASWHFANVPLGLNYEQFSVTVVQQDKANLFKGILINEKILADSASTFEQRAEALKFLIHLVGDAHQPMHVSREEDKGGNTIQMRFNNKGTNLHSLWDSRLIDKEGLNESEMAVTYDKATPLEIKKWQADFPMVWLWESYQISSELYKEAEIDKHEEGQDAYKGHLTMIHRRIDQAGIRLAGVLNMIADGGVKITTKTKIVKVVLQPPPPINSKAGDIGFPEARLSEVGGLVGKPVTVKGEVFGVKPVKNMTLIDVGAAYPNQRLTVVLKGEANGKLDPDLLQGKTVQVSGYLELYRNKPEIIITDPHNMHIE